MNLQYLAGMVKKLPPFDSLWPDEKQAMWWRCYMMVIQASEKKP